MEDKIIDGGFINTVDCQKIIRDDKALMNNIEETINKSKYNRLLDGIRSRIFDLVDSITDDYLDNLTDTIDDEIRNIKENNKFLHNEAYRYRQALDSACDKIFELQGYRYTGYELVEKRIALENEFLEKV